MNSNSRRVLIQILQINSISPLLKRILTKKVVTIQPTGSKNQAHEEVVKLVQIVKKKDQSSIVHLRILVSWDFFKLKILQYIVIRDNYRWWRRSNNNLNLNQFTIIHLNLLVTSTIQRHQEKSLRVFSKQIVRIDSQPIKFWRNTMVGLSNTALFNNEIKWLEMFFNCK